jgi:hypothetical protein
MNPELKASIFAFLTQTALPLIFTGLGTAASWAFVKLGAFLGTKAKESKLAQVGARLADLCKSVVADLEATLRPRLAEATADGKLTKAEIIQLRAVALERLKQLAGEKWLDEARAILGIAAPSFEKYLMGVLERAVDQLPKSTPAPSPAPAPTPVATATTANP